MKTYSDVIVVGSIAYDEIMHFPSQFSKHFHQEKLDQINISFVVNNLEKHFGGTATNIAYNFSLVSEKRPKIIAAVGKDGNIFIDFFQNHNIDTSAIIMDESLYTATGKVITDTDENQIWGFYYGACVSARDISLSDHMHKNDLLILSPTHKYPFLKAQKEAIAMGIDYLYDPGMSLTYLSHEDLYEGIINATWLVGNEYEINHMEKVLKKSKQSFIDHGVIVITTLGEKGVLYEDGKDTYTVPALQNVRVVDPTGAGDAWRAGFIGGVVEGMSVPDTLHQGNVLAGYAIEHYGTVNHAPTYQNILNKIQNSNYQNNTV